MKYPLDIAGCHKIIRAQQDKIEEQAKELKAWADYDAGTGNALLIQWAGNIRAYFAGIFKDDAKLNGSGYATAAARILVAAVQMQSPSHDQLWRMVNTITFHNSTGFNPDEAMKSVSVMVFKARHLFKKLGLENPFIRIWGQGFYITPAAREWVNQFKINEVAA